MNPTPFDPRDAIGAGYVDRVLADEEIAAIAEQELDGRDLAGKRVLLIVPDATRTVRLGVLFRTLHRRLRAVGASVDVMIALGTHHPMSDAAICRRLEITEEERARDFAEVRFRNHAWDRDDALATVGTLSPDETEALTDGLLRRAVPVRVNRAVFDYDQLYILGPVFPHEVIGFSGGNKYLFPGISGPEVLNFFHWLGALVTSPRLIGHAWTPVRRVVDRAAALVPTPCRAFCLVVRPGGGLSGVYAGGTVAAWARAVELSDKLHITYVDQPFRTVLAAAPAMYDDLWVGGKCMYKLEPVVADGGELIIYAPHITEISVTHGAHIERIGYHVVEYFTRQWERFQHEPWGAMAHATHVRGVGTYEGGIEKARVRVTLATGIPEEVCAKVCLGYRDPASINPAEYMGREAEGVLYVPKAGEQLYRLNDPPAWAKVG